MTIDPKILDAKNNVEAKRAQLMNSVKYGIGEAKRRLAPDLVADQVWEVTKDKAERAAHEMMVNARSRPWLVGGVGAAIGLFLARGPIGDGVRSVIERFDGDDDTPAPEGREKPAGTPVEVARQAKNHKTAAKKTAARKSKTEVVK